MTTEAHTLAHALTPEKCKHEFADITNCVICGRTLHTDRKHMDTCAGPCFSHLIRMQRRADGLLDSQVEETKP